ncbi:hypothetical protein M6B38_236485 [Iris pallida]|uniref:Uncharacterized protein n=1 Tax=Iris pallida TaxID=29817 RepID=A0AAX6DP18_IRIPA|nr:hypothetical protein M6B38_236485 [Iris pallida]
MYRCESIRELRCPEQRIELSRCEELHCPKEMHRVESIRSAALPQRISALSRLEDSKKSNLPKAQVRIDASIDFSWFHVQAIRLH